MPDIGDFLSNSQLEALRASFRTATGRQEMAGILRGVLPELYTESRAYVGAIVETYFDHPPDARTPDPFELNESDRERCIIALLAAQGGQFTLALHLYLALMLDVTPQEVSHILLLAGVYSGVNRFAEGMFVHVKMLQTLQGIAGDTGPKSVNKALRVAFGIDPPPRPEPAAAPVAAPAGSPAGPARNADLSRRQAPRRTRRPARGIRKRRQ